jgi:hypothetical protein
VNFNELLRDKCIESDRYDLDYGYRLNDELEHIETQELATYYLAMQKKGIKVETHNHLVAFLLGLTDDFDENSSVPMMGDMPDIDVDFSVREPVVEYLKKKYGEDHVAYINNYTHLSGKSAVNDVSRVMEISVPKKVKDIIHDMGSVKTFLKVGGDSISENVKKVLEVAAELEGNIRHMGITAAGVIVSKEPITNYTALYSQKDKVAAVIDKDDAEKIGFIKMDILVTTNIAAMQKCMELIKQRGGKVPKDVWDLPMDDQEMIDEFAKGHTDLIFQYGGYATKDLCKRMKPDKVEDVVAANALSRKGADDKAYIRRKKGEEKYKFFHPVLKDILEDTYGIMVYQEQVMSICRHLAGMTHRDVNRVRKMVGKKTYKEEPELRHLFIMGCIKNEVEKEKAEHLWAEIKKHGEYSFNRAHCVVYFLQAWANMYFQVHHPFEWFLANLMLERDDKKIATIISAAQKAGVKIADVDVNKSEAGWSYDGDTLIPGLSSVIGVGLKTGEKIAREAKKSRFVGWNTVITNRKQDDKKYYLLQEHAKNKYKRDIYKDAPEGWVMIPKNAFDALSAAGAIPKIDGDETQANLASGKAVDVTEGKDIHEWWSPVPLGEIKDIPCVVHGYVKNHAKRGGSYELNIQSDVPGSLWSADVVEPGGYLLVVDGKWGRVYYAVSEDRFDRHPMSRYKSEHLLASKGPGIAYVVGSNKINNMFVTMVLAPQPRTLWLNKPLEKGWYAFKYDYKGKTWQYKEMES